MANLERKTYTVDAKGKILGRLATDIAKHLIGKTNPAFQPHMDVGDFVVVENVREIEVTGNKYEDKKYYSHSGQPGGLKTRTMRNLWEKDPALVLQAAVSRMLPKNKHRKIRLMRLTIK